MKLEQRLLQRRAISKLTEMLRTELEHKFQELEQQGEEIEVEFREL